MAESTAWIWFHRIIMFELFVLIAALFLPFIGIFSVLVSLIIVVFVWVSGKDQERPPISEIRKFFREHDVNRLLLGLIFVMAAVDIFAVCSLGHTQYDSTSLAIYLGLYLTGVPIIIDGIWPKR